MYIRKLVKAGQSSHTVSLPKSFIERNNLGKGDTLYLVDVSDKELKLSVVMEKKTPEEQKTLEIDTNKKDLSTIRRELTAAYINNYSTIRLVGENVGSYAKEIRETIHHFVALEISEQTANSIVAKDMLNMEDITISDTIKRMDMILRSIISDSIGILEGKDHASSIHYRDEDVNRLYFLLSRILKNSLKRKEIASSFNLKQEAILGKWFLVVNIENIADTAKTLNLVYSKVQKKKDEVKEFHSFIERAYIDVMKAYYNQDHALADDVAQRRITLFKDLDEFLKKNKTVEAVEFVQSVKEFITHVGNIAKIVIDEA